MTCTRRQFAQLIAAAIVGSRWAPLLATAAPATDAAPSTRPATQPADNVVDAGPADQFVEDKVYDQWRKQGAFLIRRDDKLFALGSTCTHKGCRLFVDEDQSFYCKCHGSEFDRDGHVSKGPARRNLPRLALRLDQDNHVLVDVNRPVANQ